MIQVHTKMKQKSYLSTLNKKTFKPSLSGCESSLYRSVVVFLVLQLEVDAGLDAKLGVMVALSDLSPEKLHTGRFLVGDVKSHVHLILAAIVGHLGASVALQLMAGCADIELVAVLVVLDVAFSSKFDMLKPTAKYKEDKWSANTKSNRNKSSTQFKSIDCTRYYIRNRPINQSINQSINRP